MAIAALPVFIDCLGPRNTVFSVKEGGHITTTCIYTGVPLPYLECALVNLDDLILGATEKVRHNYTDQKPLRFFAVKRSVRRIKCTAKHNLTGTAISHRPVLVLCKYHCMVHCYILIFSFFGMYIARYVYSSICI